MSAASFRTSGRINFIGQDAQAINETARMRIVTAILIYFLLIIFEGALRKWFLPSFSGPLLVIRDPLALWILIAALRRGYLNLNIYSSSMLMIGFIALYTAYFLGHGNLMVAIYGARIFLLHIPLIFVIANTFNKQDILKLARYTIIITIPMAILIVAQFYSPQSAWINKSVGGIAGGGFSGAMNFFRPPGTFSFTNGNSLFFNLSACFTIYFWFHLREINRYLLIISSIALLVAVPFSISRTLLFQVVISILFALICILMKPKYAGGLVLVMGAVVGITILMSFSPFFSIATEVFSARFESANTIEGGINGVFFNRFLGGMIEAVSLSSNQPFFGYGVGMGTNAGSMLLTGGRQFLISEGEWGRLIGELGPVLGLSVVFLRLRLAISILIRSFEKLKYGIFMPWMLTSFGALSIAQAGWAQPTSLGFCVVLTGSILAALNETQSDQVT